MFVKSAFYFSFLLFHFRDECGWFGMTNGFDRLCYGELFVKSVWIVGFVIHYQAMDYILDLILFIFLYV